MNILLKLGSTIYLKLINQRLGKLQASSLNTQRKLFLEMKKNLKGTTIFEDLNLEDINSYEEYLNKISVKDYNFYSSYIQKVCSGEKGVMFNDTLDYIGVTSGTSGYNSKFVPYNSKMLKTFLDFPQTIAASIYKAAPKAHPITSKRLNYGSPMPPEVSSGIQRGYISGIIASKTPNFIKKQCFPKDDILEIRDWNTKVNKIVEQVRNEDIRILSGVPNYLINICENVIEAEGAKDLSTIWPNLEVFIYSGTHIDNFKNRIDTLAGKKLKYLGGYISTEAPIGYPAGIGDEFEFNLNRMLFSFNNIEDESQKNLGIHELETGKEYLLNIGTPNGMLQYEMKDIVKITQINPKIKFQISGRKGNSINIAAEKIDQITINKVIENLKQEMNINLGHYFIYPSQNQSGESCYELSVVLNDKKAIDRNIVSNFLDKSLMKFSTDYEDCRIGDKVIGQPIVNFLPKEIENAYFHKYNAKGQLKMKNILDSRENFFNLVDNLKPGSSKTILSETTC